MPVVRAYRPEDLKALAELFHAAVHAVPDALYGPEERELWAPSPPELGRWRARFEAAPPVVALVNGRIAGFMSLEDDGHLDLAYVHPDLRGRGVAGALLAHLEERAERLRLGRLFAAVSHAARPFFERRGFVVVRPNEVERGGRRLGSWIMEKRRVRLEERGRLFVIGNSGAGKSTLARVLAEPSGRARIDLDEVAFADQVGTRRPLAESLAMLRERRGLASAVVEGCYADLVEALATPDDHLLWLDLPVEACVANAEARPWEPHKWPTAAMQHAFLPQLVEFIRGYDDSPAPTGRPAHRRLFAAFVGTKEKHVDRPSWGDVPGA